MKKNSLYLLIFLSQFLFCQEPDTVQKFVFRCTLVDAQNKKGIAFAHIYNESRKFGVISDTSGYFATNVKVGDTLALMALGYLAKIHIIQPKDSVNTTIGLSPRTYQIDEVSLAIPRTYREFKEAFLEVEVDKDRPIQELPQHNPYKTPQLLDTNVIASPSYYIFHPVSALYHKFSKVEKSKRKVWYLKEQELKQASVDEKYNREIVSEITGFTDWNLINFMGWCNFSFNYLYDLSALEIREKIESRYEEYLNCCYNVEKDDTRPERD